MLIYFNQKVENLEKPKALTFTLKKEVLLYPGAPIFLVLFGLGD